MSDAFVEHLRTIVGAAHVLTDPDVRASYERDWTGRYGTPSRCVVRPRTPAQVAEVVAACAAAGQPIVPQGGNTGLVGGGVPRAGEVLVSLRRLERLDPIDAGAASVVAGAGITIETLQRTARAAAHDFAVDWGARASATVGGAIATNAGGSRVVRFGTMRAQVLGIEAVLADGTVIDTLDALPKSTTGLHVPSLFAGSEGTLAVITAARLRLVPWYRSRAAAWVGVASLAEAVEALAEIRAIPSLDGVEVLTSAATDVVSAAFGLHPPLAAPVSILVEAAAHHDPTDELEAAVGHRDGVIARGAQLAALTTLRDHVSMAINTLGVPLKLDVAVPLDALDLTMRIAEQAARTAGCRLIAFGHLAEGNLHLNFVGATLDDAGVAAHLSDTVLGHTVSVGGTVSAEHGIGVAKRSWMPRLPGFGVQAAIKRALDPAGVLNPGVLYP